MIRDTALKLYWARSSQPISVVALELIGITAIIFAVALKSVTSEDLALFDETAYLSAGVGS